MQKIHERSPISVVHNVTAPTLLLIGESDMRVPPHQAFNYMNALKQRGVLCRVLKYPGEGHSLEAKPESSADCTLNIALWLDKYLIVENN